MSRSTDSLLNPSAKIALAVWSGIKENLIHTQPKKRPTYSPPLITLKATTMTILITGGTGKTGFKLAKLLHAANHSVLITSRKGVAPEPFKAVTFDWNDASTFENPFKADANINKVYLVAPSVFDALPVAKPFIDLAISKGVKRFVLLSATQLQKGGVFIGKIHEYIASLGVEYTVLRPTWFIENFGSLFIHSINNSNTVASVTKNGKIPFIGVDDIAKAAFDALLAEKSSNSDFYVVGPELLTYDQATEILSEVIGRKITHTHITNEQEQGFFRSIGMSPEYAAMLNGMEAAIADDAEEKLVGTSKTITGTHKLRDYFEANKALWTK
ncbi:unnamed protein product [Cyclocybe aegerita]|uniref:NmrA-like domain-containing protein n=1 Tax=Cyclocybe aegerita TaxID=1973307 RepID=A0A8S0WB06_CYCAE|nr:unnamed protein product [Cyclocybe aegerita]